MKNKEKKSFLAKLFKAKDASNLELLEADLLKDEVDIKFNWRKDFGIFLFLFFIVFVIIVELYIFLELVEKRKVVQSYNYLKSEIVEIREEFDAIKPDYDVALNFNNKLKSTTNIFNKHIYWTNFFSFLEENTLRNVYYKSFSGNTSAIFNLPSVTDNVMAVSFQSKTFSLDPLSSSVLVENEEIVNDIDKRTPFINFNLNLRLRANIFN